jgi:hypothetical protein
MNVIFTDIDGFFLIYQILGGNTKAIQIYNRICDEFDLQPVITSTWRTNHSIYQLQNIFLQQGITQPIYDFTPIIPSEGRGIEIENWIITNQPDNYIILDDNVGDIQRIGLKNIIKCRGWLGLTEDEYEEIKKIFNV